MLFKPRSWQLYLSDWQFRVSRCGMRTINGIHIETPLFDIHWNKLDRWIKPHLSQMGNMPNQHRKYYIYAGKVSVGVKVPCRVGDDAEFAFMNMTNEERDAYLNDFNEEHLDDFDKVDEDFEEVAHIDDFDDFDEVDEDFDWGNPHECMGDSHHVWDTDSRFCARCGHDPMTDLDEFESDQHVMVVTQVSNPECPLEVGQRLTVAEYDLLKKHFYNGFLGTHE